MADSTQADRAWTALEIAGRALAVAEQRQRWKTYAYNPPGVNERLQEEVDRARRRVDAALEDVAVLTGYEADDG